MTSRQHSNQSAQDQKDLLIAWIGILLAPATWIVSFELNYALVPFACQSRSTWPLHSTSIVALVIAGVGLIAAGYTWSATGKVGLSDHADPVHRNGFLGMFGLLFSGILMVLISAQWIPVFFVDPCNP